MASSMILSRILNSDVDVAPPNSIKDNFNRVRLLWNSGVLFLNNRLFFLRNSRTAFYSGRNIGYQISALNMNSKKFYEKWFCMIANRNYCESLSYGEGYRTFQWNRGFFSREDVRDTPILNNNAFKVPDEYLAQFHPDEHIMYEDDWRENVESRHHNIMQVLRNIQDKGIYSNNLFRLSQVGYNLGQDAYHREKHSSFYAHIISPQISNIMEHISYSNIVWKFEHPQPPQCSTKSDETDSRIVSQPTI
jgi:hypothetical protein